MFSAAINCPQQKTKYVQRIFIYIPYYMLIEFPMMHQCLFNLG